MFYVIQTYYFSVNNNYTIFIYIPDTTAVLMQILSLSTHDLFVLLFIQTLNTKQNYMYTGIVHTHTLVVILFLIMFGYKTFLLLTNQNAKLEVVRNKTKILEMVFGTLILCTGGYLLSQQPVIETWLIVKFALFMVGIPLGIIGIKRSKKALALISLLIFILVYGLAEMKGIGPKKKTETPVAGEGMVDGKALFINECAKCHGTDGKLGMAGAADLSTSALSAEVHADIIKNGKGTMPKFDYLTEMEIAALVEYISTLK